MKMKTCFCGCGDLTDHPSGVAPGCRLESEDIGHDIRPLSYRQWHLLAGLGVGELLAPDDEVAVLAH